MARTKPRIQNLPRNLKPYFLAIFRPGECWNQIEGAEDLPARQLAFLRAQFDAGVYRVAGPVTDGGEIAAMAILEAENLDSARAIAMQDPGVQEARLTVEVHSVLLPSLNSVQVIYEQGKSS